MALVSAKQARKETKAFFIRELSLEEVITSHIEEAIYYGISQHRFFLSTYAGDPKTYYQEHVVITSKKLTKEFQQLIRKLRDLGYRVEINKDKGWFQVAWDLPLKKTERSKRKS